MRAVFLRIFKEKRQSLVAYIIGAAVFVEMYLALFPTLQEQAEMLNKLLEAYPKGLMSAFGFEGTAAFFSTVENYMSTEFFSFFWPILTIIMMISFANSAIAGEVEKGTIELTLAQPLSRLKIYFARYFAGLVYFAIFSGASIFSIALFAKLHNFDFQLAHYFTTWAIAYLFGVAIFSMAMLFSASFSEKGKATFLSAGILLAMYALNIIAGLKESLKNLKYFSFFHYFNAPQLLGKNEIADWSILVFGGVIVVCTLAGAFVFQKRDLAT